MPVPAGLGRRPAARGARLPRPLGELGAPAARGRRGARARRCPRGTRCGPPSPEEYRAAWTVQEDAFLEWSDRDRQTYEDWESSMTRRPGFEPWNLRVVLDPAGAVVAMAMVQMAETTAFIARLATTKEQRGQGLAQALLVDAFAVGRAHGAPEVGAVHRLAHRRARALREGRHGRRPRPGSTEPSRCEPARRADQPAADPRRRRGRHGADHRRGAARRRHRRRRPRRGRERVAAPVVRPRHQQPRGLRRWPADRVRRPRAPGLRLHRRAADRARPRHRHLRSPTGSRRSPGAGAPS